MEYILLKSAAVRPNHPFTGREAIELAHQNHFGSDCAPEACRMASPCQCEAYKVSPWQATLNRVPAKTTKATGQLSTRTEMPEPSASQQYTPKAMPSSATMEGTISTEMGRPVRGQTLLRAKTMASEKQRPTPERKLGRRQRDKRDLRKQPPLTAEHYSYK